MTPANLAKYQSLRPLYTSVASLTRPANTPTYTANDVVGGPSATVTFTNATPTVVSWAAHGLVAGDAVNFRGTPPTGLAAETVYYAIIPVANPTTTIRLAATYADAVATVPVPLPATGTATMVGAKVGSSILVFPNMGEVCNGIEVKASMLTMNLAAVPGSMVNMRLHLYSNPPPSLLNDDDLWTLSAADLACYLGYIDLGTPVDVGPVLVVQAINIGRMMRAPVSNTIYGYLSTGGAYISASGTIATVKLFAVNV
jgi:hypothetical protein